MKEIYNDVFFDFLTQNNYVSAKKIVPIVFEIVHPKSVVDFGCGVGCWLKAFSEMSDDVEVMGIDGYWLKGKDLLIEEEKIKLCNLENPISFENKFDLAISLEVAEHISTEKSDVFLENITNASDIVLFSAAIPQQGGTGHVNERWQSYWVEKMEHKGYECLDFLRKMFWNDEETGIYRQNIFLFVKKEILHMFDEKIKNICDIEQRMIDVVHPMLYSEHKVARKFKDMYEKLECENKKNRYLFELMTKWVDKKNQGSMISDFLAKNNIKIIGIYGMGVLGKAVFNELKDSCYIEFCTDRYIEDDSNPMYIRYKNNIELPYVDAVIVTAPMAFDDIKKELQLRFLDGTKIINIAEIVDEM